MLLCCFKCRKKSESKKRKDVKTKNGRIILLSKCAECHSKKSKFIRKQEASGLLRSSRIKKPLSQISFVGTSLF